MARINYVELPTGDAPASKGVYEAAFGWRLTDFGPSYAATTTGDAVGVAQAINASDIRITRAI